MVQVFTPRIDIQAPAFWCVGSWERARFFSQRALPTHAKSPDERAEAGGSGGPVRSAGPCKEFQTPPLSSPAHAANPEGGVPGLPG